MNPAMLEASDDLTNLSHLNEPAGNAHLIRWVNTDADGGQQFYKPSGYDTHRKRYIHTVVSSLSLRTPSRESTLSMSQEWFRYMQGSRERHKHRTCSRLRKKPLRRSRKISMSYGGY